MVASFQHRLAESLRPSAALDARVRIDQLQAIARANVQSAPFNALIAVLVALLDVQWVSPAIILTWTIAVLGSIGWGYWASRTALAREFAPGEAGAFTLDMMMASTPLMLLWPTMVICVWLPGDMLNNALLVTFLFASMAASVWQTGFCRYVAAPGLALDILVLATHSLTGSDVMAWLGPIVQVLAGLLICRLSLAFERTYRIVTLHRLEKEEFACEFSKIAEELSRSRDLAQDASRAKSEFLSNMSHELRTPLNAIIGFSDMVRSQTLGPVNPPKYADYIDHIHQSGLHLLGLVNDLLDLAKIEAGKYELHDTRIELDRVAANALRLVEVQARKGGVSLSSDLQTGIGLVADERAVTQVLTNLLSNAVKFTHPGGTVSLFAYTVSHGGLALGVRDTGIGMEPEDVSRALEPFVQVAHITTVEGWGTGLGLPLAKSLIQALGGSFHIESHPGIGTCAWGEFSCDRTLWQKPLELNAAEG